MAGRVWQRGKTYHIAFSYKGVEYRKSALTDKKRDAEQLLSFYLGQVARSEFKGFEDTRLTYTLEEMLADFIADCQTRGLRAIQTVTSSLVDIRAELGKVSAGELTERQLDIYIKQRKAKGRMPATLKREMGYVRQAYKLAMRKKLVTGEIPYTPTFKVSNVRKGFFEREDFNQVVEFLPNYLKNFARFAYLTGWRKGEITNLSWRHVVDEVIRLDASKNDKGRVLVIVGEIAEIIEEQHALRQDLLPWVFHWKGKPLDYFYTQWRRACKQAGVQGRLFHDFRRTAVRNMNRAGVPRSIAKQISGHKTDAVFNRYDIVDEEDIRQGLLKTQEYISQLESRVTPLFGGKRTPDGHQTRAHQ
jgi:integrase